MPAAAVLRLLRAENECAVRMLMDEIDVPLYSIDSVVRRARALQLTPEARRVRGEEGA